MAIQPVSVNFTQNDEIYNTTFNLSSRKLSAAEIGGYTSSDTVEFTAQAKKLNAILSDRNQDLATRRAKWVAAIEGPRVENRFLGYADKHIAKVGQMMEQMLELAKAAQDETLGDEERILLQIEMGRLQHDLNAANAAFGQVSADPNNKFSYEELLNGSQKYEDTRAYRMLRRAAERIWKGEEWDVGELEYSTTRKYDESGQLVEIDGVREVLDYLRNPQDLLSAASGEGPHLLVYEVTDDPEVPTVGNILKRTGRSLMDIASAKASEEQLEKDLRGLRKQEKGLVDLVKFVSVDENRIRPAPTEDEAAATGGNRISAAEAAAGGLGNAAAGSPVVGGAKGVDGKPINGLVVGDQGELVEIRNLDPTLGNSPAEERMAYFLEHLSRFSTMLSRASFERTPGQAGAGDWFEIENPFEEKEMSGIRSPEDLGEQIWRIDRSFYI